MKPEMRELLKDLADVLEKHRGGLCYTTDDDGVHVIIGYEWKSKVCIGFTDGGNVAHIRNMIKQNQ